MHKPLISVVTAVYNTKKYLDKAITSVLNQTFQDFEYIIVDDGSTDGSYDLLQEYKKKHPEKIRLFRQENRGAFPAYNKCTELAEGQYIMTLNSDDYLLEDCLEIISTYVINHEVDIVFINTASHVADIEQNIIKKDVNSGNLSEEFIILDREAVRLSWPFFIRLGLVRDNINLYKTSLMKNHPYNTGYYGADYMFNIIIADEITSVACHPKNLYQNFTYDDNTDVTRNISVGKYYPYEHEMFNEFYTKYKDLFKSWNTLDFESKQILSEIRVIHLYMEMKNVLASNNKLSYKQNITNIILNFDDIIIEISAILKCREYSEKLIIDACRELLKRARQTQVDIEHPLTSLIDAVDAYDQPIEKRAHMMIYALFDSNNPLCLGLTYYEKFCNEYPSEELLEILDYLKSREQARVLVLTGKYERASEEITRLFNLPFSDPEKYLLLGMNCFFCGFSDDALDIISVGLEMFSDYQRLIDFGNKLKTTGRNG